MVCVLIPLQVDFSFYLIIFIVIADETEQALINNNVNRTTLNGNLHPEEMVQGSQMTVYANQQPLPPRWRQNGAFC